MIQINSTHGHTLFTQIARAIYHVADKTHTQAELSVREAREYIANQPADASNYQITEAAQRLHKRSNDLNAAKFLKREADHLIENIPAQQDSPPPCEAIEAWFAKEIFRYQLGTDQRDLPQRYFFSDVWAEITTVCEGIRTGKYHDNPYDYIPAFDGTAQGSTNHPTTDIYCWEMPDHIEARTHYVVKDQVRYPVDMGNEGLPAPRLVKDYKFADAPAANIFPLVHDTADQSPKNTMHWVTDTGLMGACSNKYLATGGHGIPDMTLFTTNVWDFCPADFDRYDHASKERFMHWVVAPTLLEYVVANFENGTRVTRQTQNTPQRKRDRTSSKKSMQEYIAFILEANSTGTQHLRQRLDSFTHNPNKWSELLALFKQVQKRLKKLSKKQQEIFNRKLTERLLLVKANKDRDASPSKAPVFYFGKAMR
jgi:hypothetical protein